ncbi:MAG: bifunctional helix-turn-helix transcriptional regulator/GNAT family N-acetyltransferase [bacterium]|nr:MAG: bifunctional helix-turn-helix transcriptional regulator/GNAT family N-acetyltransferase [bacterium]
MDLIKRLGPMALGSRLKRLTIRMNKDISRLYRELGIEFEARWFPVAYLLRQQSPLSISEIADELNYSHTAIKNFTNEMLQKGLLESNRDPSDRRRRLLQLSRMGRHAVDRMVPVWREVRAVAGNLVESSEPNLLASIEGIEQQLDQKEMYPRIRERLRPRLLEAIEILDYRPAYKKYFWSLNYEWLKKYFRVERADEKPLSDPKGQIINRGGVVLYARLDGQVVGTAALVRHEDNVFELTKMAVTATARRRMVGTKLTLAIIERAKSCGAERLFLETHPKLKPAQRLYEKIGFERIDESPIPPVFDRRRIIMKIEL